MKTHHQTWRRAACAVLIAFTLPLVAAQRARAQTTEAQPPAVVKGQPPEARQQQSPGAQQLQTTEAQQLRERLRQLEQTVEELKGQIKSIEGSQKTSVAVGEAIAAGEPGAAPPGAAAPDPSAAAKKDNGGNTFEVYGFAMLDAGYQFGQNHPDWFDTVRPTKLPAFENEFRPSGHTYFGVRQSRFGARATTPTKYGDLKTTFEFELFGSGVDAGQTTFRLRHAYGELGQFGGGQYWSVFSDPDLFPNTVEYWGPNGLVWYRNVQVRWMPLKGKNSVTIALERPGASGDQGVLADRIELSDIRPKFGWPDLTGNARWDRSWGHFQVAGILRSIRWIDANDDDDFDFGGSDVGWGFSASSALNFGKNDVGRFQFTYGEGIQNYLNDAPVDIGAEANPGDPRRPFKGVALPVFAMSLYLDHKWNSRFTSAGGISLVNISNSDAQAASAFRRGWYGSGNLLYNATDKFTVGGEFIWGRRENFLDGWTYNDYRTQFAFKYNFSKLFEF